MHQWNFHGKTLKSLALKERLEFECREIVFLSACWPHELADLRASEQSPSRHTQQLRYISQQESPSPHRFVCTNQDLPGAHPCSEDHVEAEAHKMSSKDFSWAKSIERTKKPAGETTLLTRPSPCPVARQSPAHLGFSIPLLHQLVTDASPSALTQVPVDARNY